MPRTRNIHVYTDDAAQDLVMGDGVGNMGVGAVGTAITGLQGTLEAGQAIVMGTDYGVTVGPKGERNPPTVMTCTHVLPGGYNLST